MTHILLGVLVLSTILWKFAYSANKQMILNRECNVSMTQLSIFVPFFSFRWIKCCQGWWVRVWRSLLLSPRDNRSLWNLTPNKSLAGSGKQGICESVCVYQYSGIVLTFSLPNLRILHFLEWRLNLSMSCECWAQKAHYSISGFVFHRKPLFFFFFPARRG